MTAVDRIFDSRPVRSSTPFRWLWIGTTTSAFGHQIALVAVLLQVWQLTGSPAWVGAMGLARAVPMIGCGLIGGALADRHDRRRLVTWATAGSVVGLALLAGQAMAGLDSLPLVLGLVAVQAASSGLAGILTNLLLPGFTPGDKQLPQQVIQQAERAAAIRRVTQPDEVARIIVFLCSAANTNTTGEAVRADGHFLTPS